METSWETLEADQRITIVHYNRWLAILGVPLAVFGLAIAVEPWLIGEARSSDAWPILAVGSLIGAGIVVAGLALCFKYDEVAADRGVGVVIRHTGLDPFRRTREWPLTAIEEVVCLDEKIGSASGRGSSLHHRTRLVGSGVSALLASCLEPEPIRMEAQRWSRFLNLPLRDTMRRGSDLKTELQTELRRRQSLRTDASEEK